jgi:hypothetical protein
MRYPSLQRVDELMDVVVEKWYMDEYRDPRFEFTELQFLTELETYGAGGLTFEQFHKYVKFYHTYFKGRYAKRLEAKGYASTRKWKDGALQRIFMKPEVMDPPAIDLDARDQPQP